MIQVPKLRPPRPHSSRWAPLWAPPRCQREARKPITVTSAKKKTKTDSAVQLMLLAMAQSSERSLRFTNQIRSDVSGTHANMYQ